MQGKLSLGFEKAIHNTIELINSNEIFIFDIDLTKCVKFNIMARLRKD